MSMRRSGVPGSHVSTIGSQAIKTLGGNPMPITSVTKDPDALTMMGVADFPVPLRRLWDAYADPRQLEKFWGPPQRPATFTRHALYLGGRSAYVMRGPNGELSAGYWQFEEVQEPRRFAVVDGFAREDGEPNDASPSVRMEFEFEETPGGSRLVTTTYFNSADELAELLEMGMEERTTAAMGQIDDVLSDLREFAAGRSTNTQILSDARVRVSRIIRGNQEQVWAAHHDPVLIQRWLLGPEGWRMPVCEVAAEVGDIFRYEWTTAEGEQGFGFTGELLEAQAPNRSVISEQMIGSAGPITINEMTLTPVLGGTLLSLVITYPDADARDMVLETGMAEGWKQATLALNRKCSACERGQRQARWARYTSRHG